MSSVTMSFPDPKFWKGKRVLLTGHTGFKGAWLALWLEHLGAEVSGVALPPANQPNLFTLARVQECVQHYNIDICDVEALVTKVSKVQPEIVLHLAAQALVRLSYQEPLATFATNVQGTANLLDAVRQTDGVRAIVVATTDKVYENLEHSFPYRETDALGGHDPYSASKAACEIVIASYRAAFLNAGATAIASARAGNVVGGGDWSDDRLVPDIVRAWSSGKPLQIRRPGAIRPWQHVLESLAGYLVFAQALYKSPELAGAYNFGPNTQEAATVRTVVEIARAAFGRGETVWCNDIEGPHESSWLALEVAKARHTLGIVPRWNLKKAVTRSVDWYREQLEGADARTLCLRDIDAYEAVAR